MKISRTDKKEFTSVSIPRTLYRKVEKHIEKTGFPSVSSYVAFVLRMILSERSNTRPNYETEGIKRRLRELGYL